MPKGAFDGEGRGRAALLFLTFLSDVLGASDLFLGRLEELLDRLLPLFDLGRGVDDEKSVGRLLISIV